MEDLSTPLLDVVNEKLMNPNMNCGQPGEVVVSTPLNTASSTYVSSSTSASVSSSPAVGSASALPNTLISDDASDSGQPILLFCGGRQNIVNAETLVLTFAYELHRPLEGVTESAAIRSLKRSMLKSVADKLSCSGSIGRLLRTTDAHQQIVAVESSLQDTPNNKCKCVLITSTFHFSYVDHNMSVSFVLNFSPLHDTDQPCRTNCLSFHDRLDESILCRRNPVVDVG